MRQRRTAHQSFLIERGRQRWRNRTRRHADVAGVPAAVCRGQRAGRIPRQSQQAIAAALAAGPGTANGAFDTFDQAIQRVSVLTQQEFDGHIRSARSHITGLAIGISLAFLLVAILVLYGFQQRIGEYR